MTSHNYGACLRECLDSRHESGLACFDSPNLAVVYSDVERFGAEAGRVSFPSRFDDHLFARQNFVDTNSLIRRSALDVANPWDRAGLAPMPEDYYMFRKLRDTGVRVPFALSR